jgi:riboflavin kinase/FMN adenylyltransferase
MTLVTSLAALPDTLQNHVVAIGNFDGVHKGHKGVLDRVIELARKDGKKSGVLTFEPHPRKLFRPDDPPFRITPSPLKQERLEACGIDTIYSLPFDWDFASQSAETFVDNILVKGLRPSLVVVGEDFRFGQLRKGTPSLIQQNGISVHIMDDVQSRDGVKHSSTTIREALMQGDIKTANDILGWEWEMQGTIVHGDRRGHELGYPTANVLLGDTLHPAYGIYAALVQIEGEDSWHKAATNIGIRPMFELRQGQIEAHILDFEDRDIYGRKLRIKPVRRLRGEAKFSSLEALVSQIELDCQQVREILI